MNPAIKAFLCAPLLCAALVGRVVANVATIALAVPMLAVAALMVAFAIADTVCKRVADEALGAIEAVRR